MRMLTRNEKRVINSRVYDKLYTKDLGELYIKADMWMKERGLVKYEVTPSGYKYYTTSSNDPYFDETVGNTRVRPDRPVEVTVIRKYYDGKQDYSAQGTISFKLKNTDHIFNEAYRTLVERNWEDLSDIEYFGYDPKDY